VGICQPDSPAQYVTSVEIWASNFPCGSKRFAAFYCGKPLKIIELAASSSALHQVVPQLPSSDGSDVNRKGPTPIV
jgi:hypothetical protein